MLALLLLALSPAATVSPAPSAIPAPPPAYVEHPVFEQTPGWKDFQRTFPDRAYREGVRLEGDVDCRVAADGRLEDCRLAYASHEGYGLEAAALEIVKALKLAPKDAAGVPVSGRRYRYGFYYEPPALISRDDPLFLQVSECAGPALARAEAAPKPAANRNAAMGWTLFVYEAALYAGFTPGEANLRLNQLRAEGADRIAKGLIAPEQDARCGAMLQKGLAR